MASILLSLSFNTQTWQLPFLTQTKKFSLMLLAEDAKGRNFVGIFSYEQLLQGEPLCISKKDCHYTLKTWNDLIAIWQDLDTPESTGCYKLSVPFDARASKKSIILIIEKHTKNPMTTLIGSLILTDNLSYKDAFLIHSDIIEEFNLTVTQLEKTKKHGLDFADLSSFADKIDIEKQRDSIIKTYVYKIAFNIIGHCMRAKSYMQQSWNTIKEYAL